jgi:DNA-directed RNA polymerase specialized sigma24 family protein
VATVLGVSTSAAGVRLYRAKAALQDKLKGKGL